MASAATIVVALHARRAGRSLSDGHCNDAALRVFHDYDVVSWAFGFCSQSVFGVVPDVFNRMYLLFCQVLDWVCYHQVECGLARSCRCVCACGCVYHLQRSMLRVHM